jgi:sugar/nucleoside kinase (ribokinase family)
MFLHCPGVNDTFCAADVRDETLAGARLFHFGYPPIMRRMFADGGRELASLFRRVKARGLATSLDMTMVDPDSEAGRVDWRALLARVLPHVDVFLPSLEEILFMLDRARFEQLARKGGPAAIVAQADVALLRRLSGELLAMGATMVVLKLGDQGLYVRTTGNEQRLAAIGLTVGSDRRARRTDGPAVRPYFSKEWLDREAHAPCFKVNVVGTTGSGDCTIAGFLAGLLRGLPLEDVMTAAVAVGACCCEKTDATSGVPSWSALQKRIRAGWGRRAANPKIRIRNPKEIRNGKSNKPRKGAV